MSVKRTNVQPKWKVYTLLILAITVGTVAFEVGTLWAAHPTQQHRNVAAEISQLDNKAFKDKNPTAVLESDEYKSLKSSNENTYSTRMSLASAVLSVVIGVAVIVAVYRYLRRNLITRKPVGATVFINTVAGVLTALPAVYLTPLMMGIVIESEAALMLAIAAPFALVFSILLTLLIAKLAEWHYNRSHGFIED